MYHIRIISLSVLLFSLSTVLSHEANNNFGMLKPEAEYATVFRTIPMLFEYLLETLQDRPEILEKDDITVFKRSLDDKRATRGTSEQSVDNYPPFVRAKGGTSEKPVINDNNTKDLLRDIFNTNKKFQRQYNGKKFDKKRQAHDYSTDLLWALSSNEVADQAIKVDQMLEEHRNNSN